MDLHEVQSMVEDKGIIFLAYGSVLTQDIIASFANGLEKDPTFSELSMGVSTDIFTVFIEISQNMVKYSKTHQQTNGSEGIIVVGKDQQGTYYIHSRNLVNAKDKDIITRKLNEVISMDRNAIKKRYRELRRSGQHAHGIGAGIGFYEVAKRCDRIDFEFTEAGEDQFYYVFKSYVRGCKVLS
ncbi:MAG: SiaB family protein kinase [Mariprofundaceae bacterium]|nr:SiaB family protein kinase [Mariprofundaceae bacterium]